jgi:hypothetical membrane protein
MNIQKIRLIKKYHTIISFIIFCSTLIYGIFKINLPITSEALSRFGTYKETNFIWISSLLLIITSICINSTTISEWNLKYKKLTRLLFNIAIFGLFNVAFINMDHNKTLHNISAGIFFLFYTISIFFTGIQMIKNDFRIAISSILISILMLISIVFLLHRIQSISEISFIILSFLWNFIIIYSIEFKKLLKLLGF